jgi:hypothetical protein
MLSILKNLFISESETIKIQNKKDRKEQRKSKRISKEFVVNIKLYNVTIDAKTVNISTTGMGIKIDKTLNSAFFHVGQVFYIKLAETEEFMTCEVKHISLLDNSLLIGIYLPTPTKEYIDYVSPYIK